MQSSTHIGKIVRQHAEAVENGKTGTRTRKSKPSKVSGLTTVPKHRVFVPMVTVWGGLLLALITAVLPDQAIAQVSALTGVYLPLLVTRIILSCGIGLAGALLGYIVATALSNRAQVKAGDGVLVSAFKSRDVQPINPSADLGSESFDAPIEQPFEIATEVEEDSLERTAATQDNEPTLGELEQRGYDIEAPEEFADEDNRHEKGGWAFTRKHFKEALIESCEGATCEAAAAFENHAVSDSHAPLLKDKPLRDRPRALDLHEFAALPTRNGVWVDEPVWEEPKVQPSEYAKDPKLVVPQEASTPSLEPVGAVQESTPANALEKLRQTPAQELGLVEMVERFAAALHDHQEQERARVAEGQIARETALAEALKALSLFTEAGFDKGNAFQAPTDKIGETEEELRGALSRLQQLRGAA